MLDSYEPEKYAWRNDLAQNGTLAIWRQDSRQSPDITPAGNNVTHSRQLSRQLQDSEIARIELSRRIINAQEADRTRLSRELHDDIGQALAILKIRMLRCAQPESDRPTNMSADLKELAGSLDAIIYKVSRLSHNLHSSTLEYLGLAAAVKRHCVECSQQLGIPIRCDCEGADKELDNTVALAFFRVVQEGIHNAIKHSRATSILVKIVGTNRDLSLEISDDGIGFDVEAKSFGRGLGLISMRERIHLIGGEFDIDSSPGRGTRIITRAPIVPEQQS